MSTWSADADRILAVFFGELEPGLEEAEVRRRLTPAYPFGPRRYHPYKVWLDRCRAWTAAYLKGMPRPVQQPRRVVHPHERPVRHDPAQERLL